MPPRRNRRNRQAAAGATTSATAAADGGQGNEDIPQEEVCTRTSDEGEEVEDDDDCQMQEEAEDGGDEDGDGDENQEEDEERAVLEAYGVPTGVRHEKPAKLGRKGKGKKMGLGGKEPAVPPPPKPNPHALQDMHDITMITAGLGDDMRTLIQCAKGHLGGLAAAGPSLKKEKKNKIKEWHKAGIEIVETRLKVEALPGIVQKVYDDLDMDKLAGDEVDDEQFMKLLDDFEEASMQEIGKKWEEITMDVIDKDEQYQNCLEELNKFVDRGSKSGGSSGPVAGGFLETDSVVSGMSSTAGAATAKTLKGQAKKGGGATASTSAANGRHSEGLEALTEYIPIYDPITRQVFKDPYVNRMCGHVYDYESILGLLAGGNLIMCPYVGCVNKTPVTMHQLVKDENMRKKIFDSIQFGDLDE